MSRQEIVNGRSPLILPAYVMPDQDREGRTLYILTKDVVFYTSFGIQVVPRGYVTDFASIPRIVAWRIHPMDRHAWAALLHDWRYAVGEPGKKDIADRMFEQRMQIDGVSKARRTVMYEAVKYFGGGGYKKAKTWWATDNFRDLRTGNQTPPPCPREAAFDGEIMGLKPEPH